MKPKKTKQKPIIDTRHLLIILMADAHKAQDLAYEVDLRTGYMKSPIYRLN